MARLRDDALTPWQKVNFAIAFAGVMALLAAAVIGFGLFLQNRVNAGIERFQDPFITLADRPTRDATGAGDGDPVNILVLGSDSRISAGDPSQWQAGAQRTDAIMILHVSGDRENAYLMSIPRDSWVEIPGHGAHKINAAFSLGGPALLTQTVEDLTGILIDHFAVADFESFAALTDELGGVEIALTQPLEVGGEVIPPGTHTLNGDQALAYTRERYNLSGGDFSRVQRQQNWVRAIARAAVDRDVLTNPARLAGLLETVGRSVAVDENFTIGDMRDLAISMRGIRPADVEFMTAPYQGTGRSPDGTQSIVLLDRERFDPLVQAFAEDDVDRYLRRNPGIVVTLGEQVE